MDRCYFPFLKWNNLTDVELHAFGDASQKNYGACVYIRTCLPDGDYRVTLFISKSRVALINTITLPRLELMGALLCARLVSYVKHALHLNMNVKVFCWTDSQITLGWIKGDPLKWKMFVVNRVTKMQSLTPPSSWHHCPGHENPADLVSRGVLGDEIVSLKFWLAEPLSISIKETESICTNEKYKTNEDLACVSVHTTSPVFKFKRWGDFSKTQCVVAWVLRYTHNCITPDNKISGPLSFKEMDDAKVKVFYHMQRDIFPYEIKALLSDKLLPKRSKLNNLDPFLDGKGLLGIRDRLENAELSCDCKHRIIINKFHLAKQLVKFHHLFLKHAGVSAIVSTLREKFWIIGIRRVAKSVIRECVRCQRHDS